jgi:hypothetical protein
MAEGSRPTRGVCSLIPSFSSIILRIASFRAFRNIPFDMHDLPLSTCLGMTTSKPNLVNSLIAAIPAGTSLKIGKFVAKEVHLAKTAFYALHAKSAASILSIPVQQGLGVEFWQTSLLSKSAD